MIFDALVLTNERITIIQLTCVGIYNSVSIDVCYTFDSMGFRGMQHGDIR